MTAAVKGVAALEDELERAKENLNDVDKTIKKLTGRTPGERRPGPQRPGDRDTAGAGRGRLFNLARRGIESVNSPLGPSKRRIIGTAFGRLGPRIRDESPEDDDKPNLQSSVVATPKDTRTRQDKLKEEGRNKQGEARNKRMFGILLGTLSKFQAESKSAKEKDDQRQAIEQKLEERARAEKDEIRKERQNLFGERRKQQTKVKRLEHKMELVQIHKEWEGQTRQLMNFIRTDAKPHLFYMPKIQTQTSEKRLSDTKGKLEDIITGRKTQLEEDIEELMSRDDDVSVADRRRATTDAREIVRERDESSSPEKSNRKRKRERRPHRSSSRDKENKRHVRSRINAEERRAAEKRPLGLQAEDEAGSDEDERQVVIKKEKFDDDRSKSRKKKSRSRSRSASKKKSRSRSRSKSKKRRGSANKEESGSSSSSSSSSSSESEDDEEEGEEEEEDEEEMQQGDSEKKAKKSPEKEEEAPSGATDAKDAENEKQMNGDETEKPMEQDNVEES